MSSTKPDIAIRACGDCIHLWACQMWTSGIMQGTDARSCTNYTTVKQSNEYYLGLMEGRKQANEGSTDS